MEYDLNGEGGVSHIQKEAGGVHDSLDWLTFKAEYKDLSSNGVAAFPKQRDPKPIAVDTRHKA